MLFYYFFFLFLIQTVESTYDIYTKPITDPIPVYRIHTIEWHQIIQNYLVSN